MVIGTPPRHDSTEEVLLSDAAEKSRTAWLRLATQTRLDLHSLWVESPDLKASTSVTERYPATWLEARHLDKAVITGFVLFVLRDGHCQNLSNVAVGSPPRQGSNHLRIQLRHSHDPAIANKTDNGAEARHPDKALITGADYE